MQRGLLFQQHTAEAACNERNVFKPFLVMAVVRVAQVDRVLKVHAHLLKVLKLATRMKK